MRLLCRSRNAVDGRSTCRGRCDDGEPARLNGLNDENGLLLVLSERERVCVWYSEDVDLTDSRSLVVAEALDVVVVIGILSLGNGGKSFDLSAS